LKTRLKHLLTRVVGGGFILGLRDAVSEPGKEQGQIGPDLNLKIKKALKSLAVSEPFFLDPFPRMTVTDRNFRLPLRRELVIAP
jgi:hypothetical protein